MHKTKIDRVVEAYQRAHATWSGPPPTKRSAWEVRRGSAWRRVRENTGNLHPYFFLPAKIRPKGDWPTQQEDLTPVESVRSMLVARQAT